MKKTQKKVWGLLGLFLVVAVTVAAANLPSPDASAVSSMTDTITVRVVGAEPDVKIAGVDSGSEVVKKDQSVEVTYENVETVKITIEYTDENGETHTYTLADEFVDYQAGSLLFNLDLSSPEYGYGDYVIKVHGEGVDGVPVDDSINFSFRPVTGDVTQNSDDTGDFTLDLNYVPDDGTDTSEGEVVSIEVNIYDENGNLVTPFSPTRVDAPATSVPIPAGTEGWAPGTYRVEIIAFGRDGNQLYAPYITYFTVKAGEIIPIPDTGTITKDLNISRMDYLATGLIIFALVAIAGIMVIVRRNSSRKATVSNKRRK